MSNRASQDHVLAKAVQLHRAGDLAGAIRLYEKVVRKAPSHAAALNLLGLACFQAGQMPAAAEHIDEALALEPDLPDGNYNLGRVLQALGRHGEAAERYQAALARKPDDLEARSNLGLVLKELGRCEEAIENFQSVLARKPDYAEAHVNLGLALHALGRYEAAIAEYEKALVLRPTLAEAHTNFGNALLKLDRHEEAIARLRKAVALNPRDAGAHFNLGNALDGFHRREEALRAYGEALVLKPDYAEAHRNAGSTLLALERASAALAHFERALAIDPDRVKAMFARGLALKKLHRNAEAAVSMREVLTLEPAHELAFNVLAQAVLAACDWSDFIGIKSELETRVAERRSFVSAFTLLHYSDDPALQRDCASNFVWEEIHTQVPPEPMPAAARAGKVRVAYLSADFRKSGSAQLFTELFELHDRSRFEIFGVSFGGDNPSELRSRVVKSFDRFVDVRVKSDREAAAMMRDLEIDIAVDLKGHTSNSRLGILARRPAPVSATWLGYQGTTGADFIDYIIGDAVALPFTLQPFFTERIVHLPECHQATDTKMPIAPREPTRREAGLPKDAFVYCCFNNNDKFNPVMFDVWMRLLRRVDGSVLWLIADSEASRRNVCAEAAARGVDAGRLVFGEKAEIGEHLARHRLADLYLDTLPMGAHTSASRTLFAGLPILTCAGNAFAGRITASLLHAVGLPELVTESLDDYEALAAKLATERWRLDGIRQKLAENRDTHPLFDTARFCRHIESAYTTMLDIAARGEPPRSFAVAPV